MKPDPNILKSRTFGSIRDLDHAPEAPNVSSLHFNDLFLGKSPPESPDNSTRGGRSTRSLSIDFGVMLPLKFTRSPDRDDSDETPRRRLGTAPGKLSFLTTPTHKQQVEMDDDTNQDIFEDVGFKSMDISQGSTNLGVRNLGLEFGDNFDSDAFLEMDVQDSNLDFPDTSNSLKLYYRNSLWAFCSVSRFTSFLVRRAPCFWCCGKSLEVGTTDRNILYRLNILCAFFAAGDVMAASFLLIALYSTDLVNRHDAVLGKSSESLGFNLDLWNLNGSVTLTGIVGLVILITVTYTLRMVREVNLRGNIRYFWTLLWLLPLRIFLVISLFDYHQVTEVWVRHWWYLPSMAWFRKLSCEADTYNTLCLVPSLGGQNYSSENEWCLDLFNSTKCREIQDSAQSLVTKYLYSFYYSCGTWGILLVLLMFLAIHFLETIITKDIIQKSRESNVPSWMLLPIIGCFTVGSVFLFSPSSAISGSNPSTQSQWVGLLYFIGGALFFISALLAWFIGQFSILNSRDKRYKNNAVIAYLTINGIIAILLACVFTGSVLMTTNLVKVPLSDGQRGRSACAIDTAQSCTYCGNRIGIPECPEWTAGEVEKVISSQYKSSATFAVIFILYAIGAIRFGLILKSHIFMYQIDYI